MNTVGVQTIRTLIQQLRHALKKSQVLYQYPSTSLTTYSRMRSRKREKENRRTTLMLVIVCVLFLITELPQGVILLLTFLFKNNKIKILLYHLSRAW